MPKVFISHASSDKDFVHRLAGDLRDQGHSIWLDEWEIKVGECIPSRIEEGLEATDFVVLVMSERACASSWVGREWRSMYWQEVESGAVTVLPVLIEDCEIPQLLRTKRYADFRTDYEFGLLELESALAPETPVVVSQQDADQRNHLVLDLLESVQGRQKPLSTIFVDALRHARVLDNQPLLDFVRLEISGYSVESGPLTRTQTEDGGLGHRTIAGYLSITEINPMYMGWSDGLAPALGFMRENDDFKPFSLVYPDPISQIEANLLNSTSRKLLSMRIPISLVTGDSSDGALNFYAAGDTFTDMYERIRIEAVKYLTQLV